MLQWLNLLQQLHLIWPPNISFPFLLLELQLDEAFRARPTIVIGAGHHLVFPVSKKILNKK